MADKGSNKRVRLCLRMCVMLLTVLAVVVLMSLWSAMAAAGVGTNAGAAGVTNAITNAVAFAQLFREGLLQLRESDHNAAAGLFGQAERAAVMIDEKAQAAYFQGSVFYEVKDYQRAEQCFQRVAAYGQEQGLSQDQPQAQARNTALTKYVSLAEIALRDCAACINPLADFPTGMYLWIKSNMGPAALASVDACFDVWDNMKIYLYIIVLLVLFLRVLVRVRRRKAKRA